MSIKNPSKTASLRNNKQVLEDLQEIAHAIQTGKLDEIFTLTKIVFGEDGKTHSQMTMSDIDNQIKRVREQKIESVIFAIKQLEQFSKFLRRNFQNSSRDHGYDVNNILVNISQEEYVKLATRIKTTEANVAYFDKKFEGDIIRETYITLEAYKKLQDRAAEELSL